MDAARKEKLGTKWTCFSCQVRFYDLNKPEPICPKCGADQRESPEFEKPKRTRKKAAKKKASIRKDLARLTEEENAVAKPPDDGDEGVAADGVVEVEADDDD